MTNWKTLLAGSAFALYLPPASATTQLGEYVTFSGFGTLGVVQTDTDVGQFVRDDQNYGPTTHASFNPDSNLGLQLTAQPVKWMSATVQVLARERQQQNIDAEVEWAYVKFMPIKGLSLLAGRMAMPEFMISDSRDIGYVNTWVRPPNEVYGIAWAHRLQGAELTYALPIKSTTLTMSVLGGKSGNSFGTVEYKTRDVKGANVQLETDWVTLRVGQVKSLYDPDPFDNQYTFTDFGASVDRNNVVAQAEFVTRRYQGYAGYVDANGWYMIGGYRFNSVLPYVSYAKVENRNSGPNPVSNPQATLAAGVRWDAMKSVDFKFQVERVNTYDTAGLSFKTAIIDGAPAPITGQAMVYSLAMDVVF